MVELKAKDQARQLKPPANLRLKRPASCASCKWIATDNTAWFCQRPGGPRWEEFDEPFWHVCDRYQARGLGIAAKHYEVDDFRISL